MARLQQRRHRRATNYKFRLKKPHWVDPYPMIPGTEPEKRLFEALMRRRIYFIFQGDLPEMSATLKKSRKDEIAKLEQEITKLLAQYKTLTKRDPKLDRELRQKYLLEQKLREEQAKLDAIKREELLLPGANDRLPTLYVPGFKPDFVLPEYKMILDPFGIFHHSLIAATGTRSQSHTEKAPNETLEAFLGTDAVKYSVYTSLGYSFYHPWWDDKGWLWELNGTFERLNYDTNAVLDHCKELHQPPKHKLTDPEDIKAKASLGYRIGKNLGAGANSVGIANHLRTKPKVYTIKAPRSRRSR